MIKIDIVEHGTMKMLPESERPYERIEQKGASALSDAELLAVIIKSGTKKATALDIAKRILFDSGGLNQLANKDICDYIRYEGIGKVKALQLMAVYEIGLRIALNMIRKEAAQKPKVDNISYLGSMYVSKIGNMEKEALFAILLDRKWHIIKDIQVSVGTIDGAVAHPREVFNSAVKYCASAVVLVHNHPSGDYEPSDEDILTTERLIRAGMIIGIDVVDHIIVSSKGYLSFYRQGLMDTIRHNIIGSEEKSWQEI